jgi:hypothetical protein
MKLASIRLLWIGFCLLIPFSLAIAQDSSAPAPQPAPKQQPDPATQQPTPSPKPEAEPQQPAPKNPREKTEEEKKLEQQEQSRRMLGVVPHFGVTRQDAAPLTPGEKFHLMRKSAFDPVELGLVAAQAGISQATDEFPGYGQGAAGYGKRFGATLADEVSSGFFSNFFWPVLLKEDPRYFRLGEGSAGHRIKYAVAQEFVCRTDSGGRSFSFSNVLGAFSSGGLSNVYYPASDRGLGLTMSRSTIALAYGTLGGLIDEFYPDIARKLFHKKNKDEKAK